jgi:hypothetical protein
MPAGMWDIAIGEAQRLANSSEQLSVGITGEREQFSVITLCFCCQSLKEYSHSRVLNLDRLF